LNINLPAIKSDFDLSDYSLSSLFGISWRYSKLSCKINHYSFN